MRQVDWLVSVLWVICCGNSQAETSVYFTPSLHCENQLIDKIKKSQHQIDIAIYSFTHWRIAKELVLAYHKGVDVRIYADNSQTFIKNAQIKPLSQKGIPIRIKKKSGKQHNKFAIFDNSIVMTGSYNWTLAASNKNNENCLFIFNEPKTINQYQQQFNKLWQKATPYLGVSK